MTGFSVPRCHPISRAVVKLLWRKSDQWRCKVLSLTQENAVDLQSVGTVPSQHSRRWSGHTHTHTQVIHPIKSMSLYQRKAVFPLVAIC